MEALVVTGSDPTLARKYLFAVYSSLYDHSAIVHMSFNYVGSFPIHLKKILVSRIHTILLARQEIPSNMYRGYTYRGMYYVYCMMHI